MLKIKLIAIACIILLSTACLHKAGGGAITPWERVTADNAIFAQSINTLEKGAEITASTGVLKPAQVAPVIRFTAQAATIHKQVTALLANGPSLSLADLTTLQGFADQLQASANELVQDQALGIKNPNSQQTITADIGAIVSTFKVLIASITQVRTSSELNLNYQWRLA